MEFVQSPEDPLRNGQAQGNDKQAQKKLKRPLNAYNLFYLDRQPVLKAEKPLLNGNEVSKLVAAEWKGMSEEEKKPYNENAKTILQKFRKENPNYHYDKSSDKKSSKKKKLQRQYDAQTGTFLHNPPNSLIQIGALTLAQFVLSREDIQADIFRSLQSGKFVSDIQQQNQQQQQQIVQTFDQTTHFDPLVAEIE